MSAGVRPADYPPPYAPSETIAAPTDPASERIEVGVLIVGAGPAGLACAIRLGQLLEESPVTAERLGDVPVAVVEKGKAPGSHLLSGAVVNPRALRRLLGGGLTVADLPGYGEVHGEAVYLLTKGTSIRIPPPPTMRNHGNWVVSLAQLGRVLAERAEAAGAAILPETDAQKLLVTDGRVRGIRTGDKGLGRDGKPLATFEPGADIVARLTILAEGTQGHLTGAAIDRFGLEGEQPQIWALGVKEVWKVPRPLRHIVHTMGWPLRKRSAGRSSIRWATTWSRSALSPGSSIATSSSRSTTCCRSSRPIASCARSCRAGNESPGARRRSPRAAITRCRSASMHRGSCLQARAQASSTCRR
jgi:electron-transferring-flavoprotein dehydrogenase